MARLASQAKGGYYAAAPQAVAAVLERLAPPLLGECPTLDPCAGTGEALLQLTQGLGDDAPPYAIELAEDRGAIVKALIGEEALAPADFLRTVVSSNSFSMVWCNPPYDYATGGEGRMEGQFVRRAADLLVHGGVLAMVCPEDVARGYDTAEFFEERFARVSAFPFPEDVRKYNETIILGVKRRQPEPVRGFLDAGGWLDQRFEAQFEYDLPPGRRPAIFRKSEPTDAELARLVAASPLRFALGDRPAGAADCSSQKPRPPLSIGAGHRALLMASGFLDGLVCPPGEPPHLIRGTADKQQYVSACETSEDEEGNQITKTVVSEKRGS